MTSTYHSQYPLLHIDLNEDEDQQVPFSPKAAEGNTNVSLGGSCENPTIVKHGNYGRIKLSLSKKKHGLEGNRVVGEGTNSSKWISSKVKLVKKMVGSDQAVGMVPAGNSIKRIEDQKNQLISSFQTDNNDTNNTTVRVCSDCNTTKTPLWRSGPRGPKSLCNACGIRQRKARRAMAAAAAVEAAGANGSDSAAQDTTPITLKTNVQKKVKKASNNHLPFKKRCKFTSQDRGRKKLCFEELSIILSKKYSTFQQVFPQDEKEAAILLMALSYGLVHG